MATKRKKIEGTWQYLPDGVNVENVRGVAKLVLDTECDGKRKRSYFPCTLEKLAEIKDKLSQMKNVKKHLGEYSLITAEERRAIEMWREYRDSCKNSGLPFEDMSAIFQRGLADMRTTTPTFAEAIEKYFSEKLKCNGGESTRHMVNMRSICNYFLPAIGHKQLHKITPEEVESVILNYRKRNGEPLDIKGQNEYGKRIKMVFAYAEKENWITTEQNKIRNLKKISIKDDSEPEIMAVSDVEKIFTYVRENRRWHHFIPILAIGFFAGARVAERCRLKFSDIFVGGRNEIYLAKGITKTNKARRINMSANLVAWLNFAKERGIAFNADEYLVEGEDEDSRNWRYTYLLNKLKREVGVTIPANALRHSAASYSCALYGSIRTSEQMGHSESVLNTHYRQAVSEADAEAYFNILP